MSCCYPPLDCSAPFKNVMAAGTSAYCSHLDCMLVPFCRMILGRCRCRGGGRAARSCMDSVPVCVGMAIEPRGRVAVARHSVHHHAIRQADDQGVLLGCPDTLCSTHLQAGSTPPAAAWTAEDLCTPLMTICSTLQHAHSKGVPRPSTYEGCGSRRQRRDTVRGCAGRAPGRSIGLCDSRLTIWLGFKV